MTNFAPFFSRVGRLLEPGEEPPVPSTRGLQVHYVAATAPMFGVIGAIVVLAIAGAFWTTVPLWLLLPWTLITLASMVPAPIMLYSARGRAFDDAEAQVLIDWITRFAIWRALMWGGGAAIFYQYATPIQLTLLSVLIVGNTMGSTSALMAIPRAASLFAVCSILPLAAAFLISGKIEHIVIGGLLAAYALGARFAAGQTFAFVQSEAELRKDLLDKQTQLKQAKLEADAANRTKSDFVAHMSHELRTPLNAIIGFSDVISNEMFGDVGTRYAGYARDINESGKHLLALINDVLDLSRIEAGVLSVHESEVNIGACAAVVERLVRERALKGRVTMKWDCSDVPRVITDERIVQQILINLVVNAIKFTGDGGSVAVSARVTSGGDIALCVADNGVGMTPAEVVIAMKPFGQVGDSAARAQGTGLGLPLCDRFARALGCTLTIDSKRGEGTTVMLLLPAIYVVRAGSVAAVKLEATGTR